MFFRVSAADLPSPPVVLLGDDHGPELDEL
jgi:hypothetical protein